MSAPTSEATFEVCPECSQKTAADFMRGVGNTRLCAPCARRTGREIQSRQARALDARYHGGLGWLWKHIGWGAFSAIGWIVIRLIMTVMLNHE